MAHPGRAGTGLWSCRLEPAGQSHPFGRRSLARRPVRPEGSRCRRVRRIDLLQGGFHMAGGPARIHQLWQHAAIPSQFWTML